MYSARRASESGHRENIAFDLYYDHVELYLAIRYELGGDHDHEY